MSFSCWYCWSFQNMLRFDDWICLFCICSFSVLEEVLFIVVLKFVVEEFKVFFQISVIIINGVLIFVFYMFLCFLFVIYCRILFLFVSMYVIIFEECERLFFVWYMFLWLVDYM